MYRLSIILKIFIEVPEDERAKKSPYVEYDRDDASIGGETVVSEVGRHPQKKAI